MPYVYDINYAIAKNSNAGVISVITKSPNTEETEAFIEATVGDYSLQKYVGSVTGPLTDTLAYSLSGSVHDPSKLRAPSTIPLGQPA